MDSYDFSGYNSAMDREQILPINQVGASTNPFQHQTEALKARIFHGASRIEFSFFGQGKSNKEQPAPESFGKREREDMRALAEFNKVQTSTHATVGVNGLSGFHQNNFSEDMRKNSVDELKRAIDFASEASTGGAVVFHTGEAPRSMYSQAWGENGERNLFQKHNLEKEEEEHYLVDPISQQMVAKIKENEKVAFAVYDLDEDGNQKYMKDENGKVIIDDVFGEPIPQYKVDEAGNIQTHLTTFGKFKAKRYHEIESQNREITDDDRKVVIKDFFRQQRMKDIIYYVGQAKGFEKHYTSGIKDREKIINALKFYKELKEKVPKDEWWKYKQNNPYGDHRFVPADVDDPVEYLKEQLTENEKQIGYGREVALSGRRQAKEMIDMIERSQLVEDYALKKATDSMCEAAMYALEKTEAKARAGDKLIEKNPLYISPESWQPESYGGHPDELKELVLTSREKLSEELQRLRGYSGKKADETAQKHIKATIDIGHLNTWKRFFVQRKNESQEQYDDRFKNWALKKTKELADDGVVGHVHLSDNYGFHDEHLTIGDGNAPVKDFVKIMKDAGIEDFIVEGGSFNPMTALPDSWAFLGSPVYSIFRPGLTEQTWSDGIIEGGFHQSYFGRSEGPRYVIGDFAPSEDYKGAPFYTGVPLE